MTNKLRYLWKLKEGNNCFIATALVVYQDSPEFNDLNTRGNVLEETSSKHIEELFETKGYTLIPGFSTIRSEFVKDDQYRCIICDHTIYPNNQNPDIKQIAEMLNEYGQTHNFRVLR